MTAVLIYRLYCEGRPCTATFEDPISSSFTSTRYSAKRRGWTRVKRGDGFVDLCKACSGGAA